MNIKLKELKYVIFIRYKHRCWSRVEKKGWNASNSFSNVKKYYSYKIPLLAEGKMFWKNCREFEGICN